jgi:hypothetical protein
MNYGAIAVLDALGFKGIWNRHEGRRIFSKLQHAKNTAISKLEEGNNTAAFLRLADGFQHKTFYSWEARFLSDTALFALMPPPELELPPEKAGDIQRWKSMQSYFLLGDLMYVISTFLSYVGCTCLQPALSYRGCLAVGEFQIEDEFVIGPAIDEAAELADVADGAFCWLTPRTFAEFQQMHTEWQEYASYTPGCPSNSHFETVGPLYTVPLKNGTSCQSRVVNPLATCRPQHRSEFIRELISTFVPTENSAIARKRGNTEDFLEIANLIPPDLIVLGATVRPLGFNFR